jgi:hypothetical protein
VETKFHLEDANMKKTWIIIITVIFSLSFATSSAFAGSKERYRWEDVAIGVGAAILGSAIIKNSQPESVTVIEWHTYHRPGPPRQIVRYCEPRQVWISPTYERVCVKIRI